MFCRHKFSLYFLRIIKVDDTDLACGACSKKLCYFVGKTGDKANVIKILKYIAKKYS